MSGQKLRVVHLSRDCDPLCSGGISTAVPELANACEAHGVESMLLSFDNWRPKTSKPAVAEEGGAEQRAPYSFEEGERILRIQKATQLESALSRARRFKPLIVHVHDPMLWSFGKQLATQTQSKTVTTAHVLHAEQNRIRGLLHTRSAEFQNLCFQDADAIHFPSQAALNLCSHDYPELKNKSIAVPLGLSRADLDTARASQNDKQPRHQECILFAGRFADLNGIDLLIGALPKLLEFPQRIVRVAGGLPHNRRSQRKWHDALTEAAKNCAGELQLLGWLHRPALLKEMTAAKLVIVPSRLETFGLVALEAMASGTPLLISDTQALLELTADGQYAEIFSPYSEQALSRAVDRTFANYEATKKRAEQAKDRAHRDYSWSKRSISMVRCYQSLLL